VKICSGSTALSAGSTKETPPTILRAETQLRELFASAIDRESEHILDAFAPEVATLVLDREDEVGYWYA
jgi:hypothetical protein